MAQATYPVGATRTQGEQLALTTSLASLGIPPNYHQARLYVPSTDFRLHLNPALVDIVFYDASADAGSRYKRVGSTSTTNLLQDLTDRDTATGSGTLLDLATTSDFLYVCFYDIAGGMRIVMTASVNAQANNMAGGYRKNDDTWTALTVTDGTDTGASLAQSGSVTWTVPTDWKADKLGGPGGIASDADAPVHYGFWARFSWNAAMGADVEIAEIWSLNKDTNRGYYRLGIEEHLSLDRQRVGAIEAILASGSDTMDITWVRTVR